MKLRHIPGSNLLFDMGSQAVNDYAGEIPQLDLRLYLNGPVVGSGAYFGFGGRLVRRFTISMQGDWNGDSGVIDERFRYHDGEEGTRCWNMNFAKGGAFTATANDVTGQAKGLQSGNASLMRYKIRIPRGQGEITVSMEDWFFLMEDGTLLNRARMTKFGLKVGEVIASFQKVDNSSPLDLQENAQ